MKLAQTMIGAIVFTMLPALAASKEPPLTIDPIALQFNHGNIESNQLHGPKAAAGIGDWYLSNGVVCAAISDTEHESELSTGGGALIDLGFCGRNDDPLRDALADIIVDTRA